MGEWDDVALAVAARSGNSVALGLLYERHVAAVTRTVLARVNAGSYRDDVRQEAGVAVLHAIQRWNPSRGARFSTYATTLAGHAVRRLLRSSRNPFSFGHHEVAPALERGPDPDEIALESDVEADLLEGIDRARSGADFTDIDVEQLGGPLTARQRAAVAAFIRAGSVAGAARELGIARPSLRERLVRAIGRMQESAA